ncbi:PTS sugar transporter subunit IIA [Haloactinopolyspora alba]|uniref:PTS sugar transporter subunit IIA n=1 Tax=Haloactinopolyspora alba TaxID=648780 RepID=UPI0013EC25A7|nr:PTS sugar transporter subunit IIA [Haloactinopolyspora alba]
MSEYTVAGAVGVEARDWRAAVRAAAGLLVDAGAASAEYPDACVATVEEHGPYIVLTPGLALAHARPEGGAHASGVVAARLAAPVEFGHPDNDPVDLVLAFSATDDGDHVAMLAGLAKRLQAGLADELRAAGSGEGMRALLDGAP